jgi:cell division protein ZapA
VKRQVEIEIYGQRYQITGDAEDQYVQQLAQYIDTKMRELSESTRTVPTPKLALLAAINITHELFQLRQERRQKEAFVEKKTKDLIERIEEQFTDLKLY